VYIFILYCFYQSGHNQVCPCSEQNCSFGFQNKVLSSKITNICKTIFKNSGVCFQNKCICYKFPTVEVWAVRKWLKVSQFKIKFLALKIFVICNVNVTVEAGILGDTAVISYIFFLHRQFLGYVCCICKRFLKKLIVLVIQNLVFSIWLEKIKLV